MMRKPLLYLILMILLGLAAGCAPGSAETPQATLPPITIQDFPTPTPAPVIPQGEPLTVGFNIRGWT